MKRRNVFTSGLAVTLLFSSCKKYDYGFNLIDTHIIRHDCDRIILQLLTNESIMILNVKIFI